MTYCRIFLYCCNTFLLFLLSSNVTAQKITIDEISDLVFHSTPSVRSIGDLVSLLPEGLRSRYVLIRESQSLQQSTPKNPRVILFGRNGNIFIAFNGGTEHGRNTIEIIEVEEESNKYLFSEIAFLGDSSATLSDPIFRSNEFAREIRNPRKCTHCHGPSDNPRINWDPYPVWPQASAPKSVLTDEEIEYLEQFIDWGEENSRYKYLDRQGNLDSILNFSILPFTMAIRMNQAIQEHRKRRFIRNIHSIPDYEKYYFMILGALAQCENLEEFIPKGDLGKFEATSIGLRQSLMEEVDAHIKNNAPHHYPLFSFGDTNRTVVGNIKWIVDALGGTMKDWGVSIRSDFLYTTTPHLFYPPIIEALALEREIPTPLTSIATVLRESGISDLQGQYLSSHQDYCEDLQQRSQEGSISPSHHEYP